MEDPEQGDAVATVRIRWFFEDDGALRRSVDLDPVATELHERHRLWLASELARISRIIVDDVGGTTGTG